MAHESLLWLQGPAECLCLPHAGTSPADFKDSGETDHQAVTADSTK